ncbi:ABC transporter substrate-binding protein [uncultured Amnibacterium sp.]|uniref:ABC transporter substrate-binding protein n=1 Tax=uncultured Amnibacterium sp. TaxID=1631851 RepID=UPI0035C9A21C
MRKTRPLLAAAIVGALALSTAACSSNSESTATKGVTLNYWASNQGASLSDDKRILTPVLAEFTKQTGIKVNLEVVGWNDLLNRITTSVASGSGPDVSNIGNTWATSLQATKGFVPFDAANMKAIGGASKFSQPALATGGATGEDVTSVPIYGQAYGLFYNKKLFADAHLSPPTTYEEFTAAARTLTDPKKGVYGFGITGASAGDNAHLAFINAAQNGAQVFASDGKPTFTSPGVVAGVQRYIDLLQDGLVNPADAEYDNTSQPATDFAKGKVAMIMSQNSASAVIESSGMADSAYGVVPYPAPSGGQDVSSHVAGINISVFKSTKHEKAALEFVKFMTSSYAQGVLGKAYGNLPALKDGDPNFLKDQEIASTFISVYNTRAKPLPLVPTEDQFETTVGKAMSDLFAKVATGSTVSEADVQSALKAAQDQVAQSAG